MRAAVFHGRQDLRLEDVPEPRVGPGEVKLRVLYNGICGSDLHEYYDGPIASVQVRDAVANVDHFTAQLVTKNHRILDASQRVRRITGGDRPVVVLVQVATADTVVQDA